MRKILCVLALSLIASMASAQVAVSTYFPPLPGSTMTGPLLLPDGTAAAPALAFTSAVIPQGLFKNNDGQLSYAYNGVLYATFSTLGIRTNSAGYFGFSSSAASSGSAADTILVRDAANTLGLRNGGTAGTPVPQTFNVYNFCEGGACATGYERASLYFSSNVAYIGTYAAGTGTKRNLYLDGAVNYSLASFYPGATDGQVLGASSLQWQSAYISRSIQGSKSKALTDATNVELVRITVPVGGFYSGEIMWQANADDGVDYQTVANRNMLTAVNKAGTITCNSQTYTTDANAVSAGTFTCAESCLVGATYIAFRLNCTSSLTETTLNAQWRIDALTPQTVTPQ